MKLKTILLLTLICTSFFCSFSQTKKELEKFIVEDLTASSGPWLHKKDGQLFRQFKDYIFLVKDCNLIVTWKYSGDNIVWHDQKSIIPIADISQVSLVRSESSTDVAGVLWESTNRLFIKTSRSSIKEFYDGVLEDYRGSTIIGLQMFSDDIGSKYKTIFEDYTKVCLTN